jgi:hypothetical protein
MVTDILTEIDDGSSSRGHATIWHPIYQTKAVPHVDTDGVSGKSHLLIDTPKVLSPKIGLSTHSAADTPSSSNDSLEPITSWLNTIDESLGTTAF